MLFSVLVPVYNVKTYLEQCLDSILTQDLQDYEVIIIDDGSTDGSGLICDKYKEKYPKKITVKHKKNEGLIMARRDAIKLAKGEYLIFCDSDDFFEPGAFSILKDKVGKYHTDIILYDLYLFYTNTGKSINFNQEKYLVEPNTVQNDISILRNCLLDRHYCVWAMHCKCVRRSCVLPDANYFALKHIQYGEDTLQSIEIFSRAKNFVYVPEKIYNYRAMSGMTKRLPQKYIEDFYQIGDVLEREKDKWNLDNFDRNLSYYYLNVAHFLLINMSTNDVDYSTTKSMLKKVRQQPKFINSWLELKNDKMLSPKRRSLMALLYHRRYLLLYILIYIRKTIKAK